MTDVAEQFSRGPLTPEGEHMFDQERLERDFDLTQRIQAGFTLNEPTEEKPHPRIIDGHLDDDGQAALSELWEAYRPAIEGVATTKSELIQKVPAIDRADLLNEGFIGLFHSSLRWHPDRDITFLTHVKSMSATYMDRFISDAATAVRLPNDVRLAVHKLNREMWRLYATREHQPSKAELAKELGVDEKTLHKTLGTEALTQQMGSIDGGYFEDDRDKHSNGDFRPGEHSWRPVNPTASEQRAIEEDFLLTDLARIVQATFEDHNDSVMPAFGLSELEKDVIKLRILTNQPLNLTELGEALGISPTLARNAEARALTKLRVSFHSVDKLKDYLHN